MWYIMRYLPAQCRVRCMIARRKLIFLRHSKAAVAVQTSYRRFVARMRYCRFLRTVIHLQALKRYVSPTKSVLAVRHCNDVLHACSLPCSGGTGRLLVLTMRRNRACVLFQSRYRCHTQQRRYAACKAAASTIQRAVRRWRATASTAGCLCLVLFHLHVGGLICYCHYNGHLVWRVQTRCRAARIVLSELQKIARTCVFRAPSVCQMPLLSVVAMH
jgi:hypothetical protein